MSTYTVFFENGNSNKRCQEKYHVDTASIKKKDNFKKRATQILVDKYILQQQQQQQQDKEKKGFAVVSLDELFFFYDFSC